MCKQLSPTVLIGSEVSVSPNICLQGTSRSYRSFRPLRQPLRPRRVSYVSFRNVLEPSAENEFRPSLSLFWEMG